MSVAARTKVMRFFAVDLSQYAYRDVRLVVERSDPVPLRAARLPYEPPLLSVFAVLLLDPSDVGERERRLTLEWLADRSVVMARQESPLRLFADIVASGPIPISVVINFRGLSFAQFGTYETRLSLDGEEIERLPVEVVSASGEA
jgi:hypothetical protein